MIIVDMAPRYYPPHHQTILSALKSFYPAKLSSRKEAEEQLRISIRDESTVQFLLKNLYWTEGAQSKLGWRFGLNELDAGMENIGKEFAPGHELETEILFIKGERSGYISDDDETSIKSIFPKAVFEVIKDSGHWVHAEKPEEFLKACLAFLEK
jgi:pimeloyl-ACP methyl ester carboxylesterase